MPIHIERARLHFGVGDDTEQSAGLEEFLLNLTEHCQVSRRNSIAEIHRAGKIMEKDINDSFEAQGQAVMGESQKSLSSVGLLSSLVVRLEYGQFLREVPPAPRLRPADWTYKHQVGVQTSPRQRSSEQSEYSEEEEEEERQDHSREPFSPPRHQETSSSSWLRPAAPAPRPPAPPTEAAQAASSPKMLPAPVPADQMPEIVRSIDRPLPSVRSRVQQLEEATAATTRDAQDRRPLRPPPGGLGRSSFGQVKVPTPRHGPHMQEVVAPPPPKAPSRKASPAPRPQEIQAHFVDYQDSHEAPSRRMSPSGSSEPLLPLSPPWQAAAPSSQDTNQAPQLPHLLCRPGRMALTELASEEAKPDSPERCRKQESHSGSEADSCRRGRRSAIECGSDRKVSPGRSDSSVDMAALEVPGSPHGGSSSRGSLQDRINQQLDKELSSHSPSEAGDAEALEAAPETQVDDLPFADLALGQKAEDIPSDAAVADFLLQMHEQTGKGQTSRSSSEANDLSAYAAQAEQGLEDGKPEEVHEEIEKETSRSSSEAEEPEQQEAETEEQADDIPLDSAQADQAVEEIKPEEVHEQIERETSRSSSEAEEPEQQEAETEEQADLPLDSAAEQSSEEIKREEAAAEMQENALAASGSEADEPEQQEREGEKQAQDVPLDTVPAPALEASKAKDPTPAAQERPQETPQVPPASSFSSFKLNACAVAFVPGAVTWKGLNAEAPQEIQQPKDAKQITEETWENYICDQKQKENLAAQATSHTEATADEETADTLSAPLEAEPLPADAVPEQALEERQPEEMDEKMDENSIRGSSEADEPEQQEAETDRQAEPLPADAVAEQALEERKPEEVDEKMDENSIRGISEADGPEQQEAETDHQAAPLPADAVAEQALEERKPEEINENMDENSIRGSSEADEPEQQKAETDRQAKPLPADAVREEALEERKPEEIDERMDENSNRSSSEAGDLPSDAVLAEQELEGSKPEEAVAEMAPISSAFEAQREEEKTPAADKAPQAFEALGAETARLRDEENVLSEYTGSEGELSKATSSCEMQDTSLGEIAEKAEESIEPAKQKAEESEEPAKEQAESREAEKAIENGTATDKAQEMEDAPDGPPEEAMDSLDSGAIEKEMEDAPEREIDDKGTPSRSEEVAACDTIGGAWRGESLSPQHRISSRVWHLMRLQPLPPPDPEDNWEMSSCGDGEMDEEEHELMLEKLRVDKKVPRWCENYLELVHQQHDWDPDSIFGQVPTCDLEEVLPDSIYEELGEKRSYLSKRRKSEGDWSRDRLTDDNVEDYKMKLGHTKAWIADVDALSPTQRAMIEGFGGVSRSRGSRDTAASPRNNASDIQ